MENEDSSGLYELSGLKAIFEEVDRQKEVDKIKKQEDFWEGVDTDYWEKENEKQVKDIIQKMNIIDENLTLNRKEYYTEVEKRTEGLNNEISKDIFDDDFKEIKEPENEIDPFWLS